MKLRTYVLRLLAFAAVAVVCLPALTAQENKKSQKVSIVFMHDVHSFMDRLARAKTLIDRKKAEDPDTFVFDAGDFSMGTLYQTVFKTEAVELRTLGAIGIDVTTSGNHEFDYGAQGYAEMLESALHARKAGETVPAFVLSNIDWSAMNDYTRTIKKAFDDYGVRDYVIIKRGGLKVAVFGIFGKDALLCAPTCELKFADQIKSAEKTVKKIREQEKPDLIVCLSHSGTSTIKSQSEDEKLAEKVPEIDLIVSGHSHSMFEKPIVHGGTYIVSCGEYSEHLGEMSLERQTDGRWTVESYSILPLDQTVPEDPEIAAKLAGFNQDINNTYLKHFGYTSDQVIAQNTSDLDIMEQVGFVMADCYANVVNRLECAPADGSEKTEDVGYGRPVDVAIIPNGVIRGTYAKGPVDVRSVFNSFSLGIGPDGIPGYPLIGAWLTGKDLRNSAEVDSSLASIYTATKLYMSGLQYTYNPRRPFLDRVTDLKIVRKDGTKIPVEPNKLYRVVSDIYTARMLGSVKATTRGLVSIVPRNADGSPVTDYEKNIIYTKNGELKAWNAIAIGLQDMGTIPDQSNRPSAFRVEKPDSNRFRMLANPSDFAIFVSCAVFALGAIIVVIILLCARGHKRRAAKKGRSPAKKVNSPA